MDVFVYVYVGIYVCGSLYMYVYVGMCVYKLVSICIMSLDGLKHAYNVTEYTITLKYKHIIIIS